MEIQKGAKIGFFSRIDYGSKGFRRAVLNAGYDEFRKEKVHFLVLAGGLISEKAISREMRMHTKNFIEEEREKSKRRMSVSKP